MADPIILSDEEERTPVSKRPRSGPDPFPTILVLDDPTPQKLTATTIVIPETPNSDIYIVKCTSKASSSTFSSRDSNLNDVFSGRSGLICLESDSEPEGDTEREIITETETLTGAFDGMKDLESHSRFMESPSHERDGLRETETLTAVFDGTNDLESHSRFMESLSHGDAALPNNFRDDINQSWHEKPSPFLDGKVNFNESNDCTSVYQKGHSDKENFSSEEMENLQQQKRKKANAGKKTCTNDDAIQRKKITKDERIRVMEEKKLKKEEEKLQKAVLKAEAAELKKMQKEKQKWEKGKFAQKTIMAEIDTKVVELSSIGGHLLSSLADKGFTYRITSNPIERSIVWTMKAPEHISELSPEVIEITYILLVYEAEEFCSLVANGSLLNHISRVRSYYPSYTICCITNRLMAYIYKREKEQYKNLKGREQRGSSDGWKSPPVEEVFAKLATHFMGVYSRQCVDEAELADHVVGLTGSLATCQFRPKLTRLSVNANGSIITKDFIDRNLMKKSSWLKSLVAIPKVQPRFAMAIWKKYPTMKSLLSVYMDPTKSLHEKEFLLKELTIEGLLGDNRRLGEVCSKRVYRILMAQSGSIKTDDIENGADYFRN